MTSLTSLLSRLQVYSENDNHEEVYQTSLEFLKSGTTFSIDALKQCLVALIKLDKYDSANSLLHRYSKNISADSLILERAYIYYKVSDDKSINELASAVSGNRGFDHILAQHYYKTGKSEEALKLYQKLLSSKSIEDADLSVNERAALYQYIRYGSSVEEIKAVSPDNTSSYDLLFNNSLIELSKGNAGESLELLEEAYTKCESATADLSEEEQIEEITPIKVQMAYVYHTLGDLEKAKTILSTIDTQNLDNVIMKVLIQNNLLSSESDLSESNPNLLYRQLDFPNSLKFVARSYPIPDLKLFERNELILASNAGKDITKASSKHALSFPGSELPKSLGYLSKAGILSEEGLDVNKLFKYARSHPDNVSVNLLAAHLIIESGKPEKSVLLFENIIESDESYLTNPAVVSILTALYQVLDRSSSKTQLLNRVYDKLLMKEIEDTNDVQFIKSIAFSLISLDDEKAKDLFKKIQLHNETDTLVSTILENTSSDSLISIEQLTSEIDVSELMSSGVSNLLSDKKRVAPSTGRLSALKKQRARKQRHAPKNLTGKIDPERWLPLKDRSYYKSKKGKKNSKDTQGGVTDRASEQSLNISNTPSTADAPSSSSSSKSTKSNAKKSNKKKGGRR